MVPYAGRLVGSFVLSHKIAEGGMASVWAAEHRTLSREVAVKFLKAPAVDGEVALERFTREGRTIARLSSPHIPQIFDNGVTDDGVPYIVMELVRGTDLRRYLAQTGCLDVAQTVRLVDQMALALGAAHKLGIVHRDVKPENIILTGDATNFHAKLVDFGIAKATGVARAPQGRSLTQHGMTIGTPSYMSPEQLMGNAEVDERSDVWSLAVVAYWALTGKLPFEGDTFASVCIAISRAHFTPATELRADLPPAIDGWFERALRRDMSERFASVELMSRMLKVAVSSPVDFAQAMPVADAVARAAFRTAGASRSGPVAVSIGGLAHTTGRALPLTATHAPSPAGSRWRATAAYAASGAALGLCFVLGTSFMSGRRARHGASASAAGPVVLTEAKISVPQDVGRPSQPALRFQPAAPPVAPAAPIAPAAPTSSASTITPPVYRAAPRKTVTVAHAPVTAPVAAATLAAPAAVAPADSASSAGAPVPALDLLTPTAAPDAGATATPPTSAPDWRPSDDMGEP